MLLIWPHYIGHQYYQWCQLHHWYYYYSGTRVNWNQGNLHFLSQYSTRNIHFCSTGPQSYPVVWRKVRMKLVKTNSRNLNFKKFDSASWHPRYFSKFNGLVPMWRRSIRTRIPNEIVPILSKISGFQKYSQFFSNLKNRNVITTLKHPVLQDFSVLYTNTQYLRSTCGMTHRAT